MYSRVNSPVLGKGESSSESTCFNFFHIRKLLPALGGKKERKNRTVQEDINPSINIINLAPLVYKKS